MRVVKEYDERRKEILDVAEKLFYTKGYEKSTINDILKEVGIAKGTFYYYFKSKEEVMDEVIFKYTNIIIMRIGEILNKCDLEPEDKLLMAFMSMNISNEIDTSVLEEMHKSENALMHQRTLTQSIKCIYPLIVKIIEEGIKKGVWKCKYPLEYIQIFMTAALTLTDEGILKMEEEAQVNIMLALVSVLEKMLEVKEGSFIKIVKERWEI